MLIDRKVVPVPAVFEKVSRHPMIFRRPGEVVQRLAKIAPMQFRAAFTRATAINNRKTRVERHGQKNILSPARNAFEAHLFSVHAGVGLQIIHRAAQSPRPRSEHAPIAGLARRSLGYETDDSPIKTSS